ncbi:MAG TPA: PLP-dependent aminotransferase family protein [Solirubrobacteraceae bacterium]|jgi:GntR family transcriptional regulator/MocR family aminotransferase|nr:PLP-dependent aminotransferase family protein [Solirubrobacteraceae bacterium]
MGTNSHRGEELLLELDRSTGTPLRAQLEDALREAVRSGRLAPQMQMPATRVLAADLGISRRLVVDAYAQLLAEGYLLARPGAGTFVAGAAAPPERPAAGRHEVPLQFDFFPGNPDLATFPRRLWLRALRETLREAPDRAFGYPDPRGALELRRALAGHLRRVRGVAADPESIVVCAGAAQAFALIGAELAGSTIAAEDPGLPVHRWILTSHGARVAGLEVDADGARVELLSSQAAAALVTPAHQSPTGVALSPSRRAVLLEWAARTGGVVIEDDYDAEFRYDRAPLGAMQGLAPERVLYTGTVSKTLAPALRLGWMVLPSRLLEPIASRKLMADHGSPTLDQLALARLLDSGAYDRHLRGARRRYRSRRDTLVAAVEQELPGARVTGLAAGLHATVRLPEPVDGIALARAAARESVGIYPLGYAYIEPRPVDDGLVLGYANLAEPAIEEGIRRLARVLSRLGPAPAET